MGMTIEELITFCEDEEHNHRLKCKRYDDASGYIRSKDKNIRTACAIREATYADFYKEISDIMRKYQKIEQIAREQPTITEQEIVKPCLEKLKEQIAKSADKQLKIAMGKADLNERYAHIRVESAFRQCIAMIDNLLSEQEVQEDGNVN